MADRYQGMGDDLLSPASHLSAVSTSDTVPLPTASKALYVGGAGDLTVVAVGDSTAVTFKAVPVGTVLHVRAQQVMSTGTTATNIVALL